MIRYLCFSLLLFATNGIGAPPAAGGNIRVLIVDGFSNHDWQQTTVLISNILAQTGGFDVSVSTAPANTNSPDLGSWRPAFSNYDVVIQNYNNLNGGPDWPGPVKEDFTQFVREGGGVYVFHSAQNSFLGWKEYEQMVGLLWRKADYGTSIRLAEDGTPVRIPAGEGPGASHGPRTNVLVARLGNHPIHADMPRTWMSADMEVYCHSRGPAEGVNVLAYGRDTKPGQGLLWPLEWTVNFGKGRVYVSTYGHVWRGSVQPPALRCAAVQIIIPRAVQWLAQRPVTIPVPADFPGTNTVSVRPIFPLANPAP